MKITYTGKQDALLPRQRAKFEAKLQKLSKMLERKGEKEVHVILTQERFLSKVEITINAFDHAMVGVGSDGDLAIAMSEALEKLEKQVIKVRSKWRDTKRHKDKVTQLAAAAPSEPPAPRKLARKRAASKSSPKIFRLNHQDGRKPMTIDEAMLEMEATKDYMVYRDAKTDRLTVLLRRADGHFDLIES
jgi:putative sigma-54 modulation protein